MHECSDEQGVGQRRSTNGEQLRRRPSEWPDAGQRVVEGRSLHGTGLADSAEPAAHERPVTDTTPSDVDGLGADGGAVALRKSDSGTKVSLAQVGRGARGNTTPLRTPSQADMAGTPVTTGAVLGLLERQQYRCALSGRRLTPQTAALDHIVPIRNGGEHVMENAQVLDKQVNRAKGSLTTAEFIRLCRDVVRWCAGK